jgi:CheY-like chemotaxis protein
MVPTSVLIVEDDDDARSVFEDSLRMSGFSVRAISQAADTFEALRTATPDVIVLDLGMPSGTLQGMEALARLREVEAWREIPVIILSGFGELVNRDITRRLGVAAILTKPLLDSDELARTIRQIQGATEAQGACGGEL